MVINTNVEAMSTTNNLNISQANLAKSLSRLSSGRKIIQPADDAAGLAVSNRLEAQIKRLDSARSNVSNAISWAQTQDGYMQNISAAFRRMSELAMLAQDSTKSNADRNLYDKEFQTLKSFVSDTTTQDYNGVSMFAGVALDVTIDSEGKTFAMASLDLETTTYTNVLNAGTDSWKITAAGNYATKVNGATLNQASHKVSKDGYALNTAANKLTVDATKLSAAAIKLGAGGNHHYDVSTDIWSASAGANTTEYKADSLIKVDGTTIKSLDGAKAVTDALPAPTLSNIEVQTGNAKLSKAGHGYTNGEAVQFTALDALETTYNTSATYYVKNAGNDTTTTGVTGDNAAGAHGKLSKAGHGLADATKVRVTSGLNASETKFNAATDYYVKNATAAYDITGITVDTSDVGTAVDHAFFKAGNTLQTGDKVKITDNNLTILGGSAPATNTDYYVRKITSVKQQDTVTVTAGNHANDTFAVTVNGLTTAAIASATAAVAQVDTVTIDAEDGVAATESYTVAVGGTNYTVTEGTSTAQVDQYSAFAGAAEDLDTFTVTIGGTTLSPNVAVGADSRATADAIKLAIEANATTHALVTVTTTGAGATGKLVLTAKTAGTAFTSSITANDGAPGTHTTAAVTKDAIGAGSVANVPGDFDTNGANNSDSLKVRDALVAKINADSAAVVTAANGGSFQQLTLTAKVAGTVFTATATKTDTTAGNAIATTTTTANKTTDAVAQVDTITIAGDASGAPDSFSLTVNGTAIGPVSWGTSNTDTATAIATAINGTGAVSGAVLATTSGADVIITAKTAGTAFTAPTTVSFTNGGGTAAAATLVNTTANADLNGVTANRIRDAINGLGGMTSTAATSGNVITITATTAGTPLSGTTSVALDNSDGANATAPTVATITANVDGTNKFELYATYAQATDATLATTGRKVYDGTSVPASVSAVQTASGSNVLTKANHGLANGDIVMVSGETPAHPEVDQTTKYIVANAATNTFTLSTNATPPVALGNFANNGHLDIIPLQADNIKMTVAENGTEGTDFFLYEDAALTHKVGDFTHAPTTITLTQPDTGTGVAGADFTLYTDVALTAVAGNFTANNNATTLKTTGSISKLTVTGHSFSNGDKVRFSHAGTVPTSGTALNATTDYFINSVDANTVKLYDTLINATANGTAGLITYTGDSSGAKLYKMDSAANWTRHSAGDFVKTGGSTATNLAATDYTRYSANDFTTSAIAGTDGVTSTAYASGEFVATNAAGGAGSGGDLTAANVSSVAKNDFVMVAGNIATEDASAVAYGLGAFISGYTTSTAMNLSASQVIERGKGAILSTSQYNNAVTRGALTSTQVETLVAGNIVNTSQDLVAAGIATKNSADYTTTNVNTVTGAKIALELVRASITKVATDRASLGASQTRLNFSEFQLSVTKQNLSAALSRIADVDVAEEATHYARYQILVATGTQMLKQANQLPQAAIELLR